MEAPFFAHSLGLLFLSLVNIDDLPLLVSSLVVTPNSYGLAFLVFATFNIKDLAFFIYNIGSLVSEQLPPSRIGRSASDVSASTVALNIK
jgi:hypothetical protein